MQLVIIYAVSYVLFTGAAASVRQSIRTGAVSVAASSAECWCGYAGRLTAE